MTWAAAFQIDQIIVLTDHLYLLSDSLINDVEYNENVKWHDRMNM
jgi:hypothetical protein